MLTSGDFSREMLTAEIVLFQSKSQRVKFLLIYFSSAQLQPATFSRMVGKVVREVML